VNRFILPIGIFVALAGVLYVGVRHSPDKGTLQSVLIGKPAPSFELPQLGDDSKKVSSAAFAGRPWVLNVWATWCVECREEHPVLLDIARQNRVPLVGLDWRDEDGPARAWIAQLGNPYVAVAVDREGRTAIDYGVYGAPETFLIGADGRVLHRHVGPMTPEVWQRDFLGRLPRGVMR
jgi:cytochrome c biogenesis protein CcmG/thiol:disulfide interchange protein DsbE